MEAFEEVLDSVTNSRRNRAQGQMSLFEMFEAESLPAENITKKPEYPQSTLLSMEKEVLGIYLSGHPLESYVERLKGICNLKSTDLSAETEGEPDGQEHHLGEDIYDNMNVCVAGVIANVKKKTTKNNAMMAFVTLEDLYGSFELLLFPKVYEKVAGLLQPESIVMVTGRLSLREDDTPKILPVNVQPIDDFLAYNDAKGSLKQHNRYEIPRGQLSRVKAFVKFFEGSKTIEVYDCHHPETLLLRAFVQNNEKVLSALSELCKALGK